MDRLCTGVMVFDFRAVGLYGGAERLPSIAFNTRDGSKVGNWLV